ncbi:GENETIC INTERACTOR OF PROHIBITINS 3 MITOCHONDRIAL [Salix koriyanagi]|uniref:GENETIC INTERACTOR OF PROHIBITINS 3 MITOCHONDRIAL n=1 Tax=Salix koriyanagi TaxID=2511006 RepID=A0A9Q0PID0_9ROSI|nr:GENETIC INTERACTOR OF PROHIBITINS 3 MITOCHONDRIAL [Salix koriyanagi]
MAVLLSTVAVTKPRLKLFNDNGIKQEISSIPINIFTGEFFLLLFLWLFNPLEEYVVDDFDGFEGDEEELEDGIEGKLEKSDEKEGNLETWAEFDLDSDEFEPLLEDEEGNVSNLDGFSPAGVGYGNITEEIIEKQRIKKEQKTMSKAERKRLARESKKEKDGVTACARCQGTFFSSPKFCTTSKATRHDKQCKI